MRKRIKKPKTKDLLMQLQNQIDLLNEQYQKSFNEISKKAIKADEMSELIKDIHLTVDKAKVVFDPSNGLYAVEINFKAPHCRVYVDNGEIKKNQFLYAVAMLNIMNYKDMTIIQDLLEQAKVQSKK